MGPYGRKFSNDISSESTQQIQSSKSHVHSQGGPLPKLFKELTSIFTVTLKGHGQGHGSKIISFIGSNPYVWPNYLKMLYLTNKLEKSNADWKK